MDIENIQLVTLGLLLSLHIKKLRGKAKTGFGLMLEVVIGIKGIGDNHLSKVYEGWLESVLKKINNSFASVKTLKVDFWKTVSGLPK